MGPQWEYGPIIISSALACRHGTLSLPPAMGKLIQNLPMQGSICTYSEHQIFLILFATTYYFTQAFRSSSRCSELQQPIARLESGFLLFHWGYNAERTSEWYIRPYYNKRFINSQLRYDDTNGILMTAMS